MRKTIEKTITALIVVVLLFNFVYSNYVPVYGNTEDVVNVLINLLGGVVGIFTWIPRLIAMAIGLAANVLTAQVAYMDGVTKEVEDAGKANEFLTRITITPFEIFFNKVQLLDVNFLDTTVGGTTQTIREAVAKWYYVVRLIAIAILLLILLYVGIRMAISSVASEKAAYKRSLLDWVVSLALVFLLHYIIMFTVNANQAIVKSLEIAIRSGDIGDQILEIATTSLGASWEAVASTVVYCMIVFQTFVFLVKYLKRMLTVGFLIIISPLISITYSIDKMGDGKAQALNTWLKEFVYNVLIQPFHCIMYMAFVDTAFAILSGGTGSSVWAMLPFKMSNGIANALLAILCIKFIDDGEKIVRKIFGFDQASSLGALETAAMATAVTKGGQMAVGAAQGARKGINFAKEKGMFAAVRKDLNNFKDRKQINSRTKDLMSKNKGMTKSEAKGIAKREANETRENTRREKIEEKSRRKNEKRENRIDAQMRKNLGAEQYEKLRKGQDTKEGRAAFEAEHAKAAQQVDKRANRGKEIRGAVGKAWNSDTGRYIRKTMVPAGIGLALGSMAYGGTNMFTAFGAGNAAFKGAQEFNRTSTNTIATEANNYAEGKVASKDELREHVETVEEKGNNGVYEKGSDETKDLIKELKSVLMAMGQADKKDSITNGISRELLQNPDAFDIENILAKAVGKAGMEHEAFGDLKNAASAYADHKSEGLLYDQIKHANDMGVSTDTLVEKMDSKIDYSMAETASGEPRDNEPRDTSARVDVNNIVTHIQKTENVEELISKIDSSDFDKAMPLIEQRLAELNKIDLKDQTLEVKAEIDKLEDAKRRISEKITVNNEGE